MSNVNILSDALYAEKALRQMYDEVDRNVAKGIFTAFFELSGNERFLTRVINALRKNKTFEEVEIEDGDDEDNIFVRLYIKEEV